MKICKKCIVHGRVQGVYFRASTQKQALLHQVTGYAKNLDDGTVEVLMCGESKSIELMMTWLHKGPINAKVNRLECSDVPLLDIDNSNNPTVNDFRIA